MQNVSEIISTLGTKRIAKKMSAPYTTVHTWVRTGKIPSWRMGQVLQAIAAAQSEDEQAKINGVAA